MSSQLALIIVDMLKCFFQPPTEKLPLAKNLDKAAQNIKTVLEECRRCGIPVIYANDAFMPAEIPIDLHFKLFGVHAVKGDPLSEVTDLLTPTKNDFVVEKKVYDGFYNTRLDSILRELKVDTVIVTGTATDCCVKHTVMGAWERGYQPIIPKETVSCADDEQQQWALKYMERFYGARIVNVSDVMEMIRNA